MKMSTTTQEKVKQRLAQHNKDCVSVAVSIISPAICKLNVCSSSIQEPQVWVVCLSVRPQCLHPGDTAEVVGSLSPLWCECALWWIQGGKIGKPAGSLSKWFFWTTALTKWKMWFSVVLLLLYGCQLKLNLKLSGFGHCVLQHAPVFLGWLSWSIIYMFHLTLRPTCTVYLWQPQINNSGCTYC